MHDYTPSTVPGCRLPHLWLGDGRSLYSELGPEFTLLRFDQSIEVLPLLMAALGKKVPIKMLDLHFTVAPEPYRHALYLSRPDQHIAWRGDAAPSDPQAIIAAITGHCIDRGPV
jgi:hypothetical protein